MSFDARVWNLVLPAALVATGCASQIPGGTAEDDTGMVSTETGETGGDDSESSSDSQGDDSGPSSSDSYGDGYGPSECPLGEGCEFDEYCAGYSGECVPLLDAIEPCDQPIQAESIPLGEVGPGLLFAANVDGDGDEELLVVSADQVVVVDDDQAPMTVERPLGGAGVVSVTAGDFDGDGVDEVLIGDSEGRVQLLELSPAVEETELEIPAGSKLLAANLDLATTPELVVFDAELEELVIYAVDDLVFSELATRESFALYGPTMFDGEQRFAHLADNDRVMSLYYDEAADTFPVEEWGKIDYIDLQRTHAGHGFNRLAIPLSNGSHTRLEVGSEFHRTYVMDGDYDDRDPAFVSIKRIIVGGEDGTLALDMDEKCSTPLDLPGQLVAVNFAGMGPRTLASLSDAGELTLTIVD